MKDLIIDSGANLEYHSWLHFHLVVDWTDLRIGLKVDIDERALRICLPVVDLRIRYVREPVLTCPECGRPGTKIAYDTGGGWVLSIDCQTDTCVRGGDALEYLEWPFEQEVITSKELIERGWEVV